VLNHPNQIIYEQQPATCSIAQICKSNPWFLVLHKYNIMFLHNYYSSYQPSFHHYNSLLSWMSITQDSGQPFPYTKLDPKSTYVHILAIEICSYECCDKDSKKHQTIASEYSSSIDIERYI